MRNRIVSGSALAASAVSMILAGVAPAAAEQPRRAEKAPTEKMACGGKNGCNAKAMESMGKDNMAKDNMARDNGSAAPAAAAGEKKPEGPRQ